MPTDAKGRFHLNDQRMRASEHAPKPSAPRPPKDGGESPATHDSMGSTTLHDHGDGTFHTEGHDGERMEHPHIGHALMHMAGKHGDGGTHMHIHHDGMGGGFMTHHHDGMSVQGPHEHNDMDALHEHIDNTMGDGQDGEGGRDQFDEQDAGSLTGF